MISKSWSEYYKDAKLVNLKTSTSDHSPILLDPKTAPPSSQKLKFENTWLREPVCRKIVENSSNREYNSHFQVKIKTCLEEVSAWGFESTGNFKQIISRLKKVINSTKGIRNEEAVQRYEEATKRLTEVLTQQEVFRCQRCKQIWLREGDHNSEYFHAMIKARRGNNHFQELINEEGNSIGWNDGTETLMVRYFNNLFKESENSWEEVIGCITSTICDDQNAVLRRPVEDSNINQALFHMHTDKSPGPDDMCLGFSQNFWSIVSLEIIDIVKPSFVSGNFDDQIFSTNTSLVPKKQNPKFMSDLRPISLCNVSYKIISKVLANRLKGVIDQFISESQSAFILGRLISDNIMISYEIIHYTKRKTKGKIGRMALKLDMSKAYDRVEWNYVEAVLCKMGFDVHIVSLFMECMRSARYKFVHAGR